MKSKILNPEPTHSKNTWHCTHCHTPVTDPKYDRPQSEEDIVFCCKGCEWVYQILSTHHLGKYYKIKNSSDFFSPAQPVNSKKSRFEFLDDDSFRKKYAYGEKENQMNFYIEGIHCVACLWLMERIGKIVEGVESSELDLGSTLLKVTLREGGSFSALAEMLDRLGYKPHAVEKDEDADKLRSQEDKSQLLQIGIAGFSAANIMFLFIAMYAGLSGSLLEVFRWASLVLFLPSITYCSKPFYKSAFAAFRIKQMNIDVPVTAALVMGSIAGIYHLLIKQPHIYFDSLSVFVFLLLSTRFFLKKLHQKISGKTDFSEFLIPQYVLLAETDGSPSRRISIDQLKQGDLIQIAEYETIAVDGEIIKGESHIDCHMLSGESLPVAVRKGTEVFAGTINQDSPLWVKVNAFGNQTRLAKIIEKINPTEKPILIQVADRIAKWYLSIIFLICSAIVLFFIGTDFSEGFNRALSLVIVACPCALALATPLAYTMGLRSAMKQGVLLKGPSVLERLALVKEIFIDKTGTLTHGQYEVLDWEILEGDDAFYTMAYALEKKSRHPVALAVKKYAEENAQHLAELPLDSYEEKIGVGISGEFQNHFYEIKAFKMDNNTSTSIDSIQTLVGLYKDSHCKIRIRLGDRLRQSSIHAVHSLKKSFPKMTLLSGDRYETVKFVAEQLQIECFQAEISPDQKQIIVEKSPYAMMVGDGANDAPALSSAFVSVAVQGSLDMSFRCSDIYFLKPGIQILPNLIGIAKQTRKMIYLNLMISLIYNAAGVILAIFGIVTPLFAAILMPISSFSVLLSSYLGFIKTKRNL